MAAGDLGHAPILAPGLGHLIAQPRAGPRSRRHDAEDWRLMRSLPPGSLVCPIPLCRTPFTVPI